MNVISCLTHRNHTKKSSKNSQTHVLEFVNIYDNQQSTFNLKTNLSLCMDLSNFWRHFWTRCVFGGLLKKVFVIVFIIVDVHYNVQLYLIGQ